MSGRVITKADAERLGATGRARYENGEMVRPEPPAQAEAPKADPVEAIMKRIEKLTEDLAVCLQSNAVDARKERSHVLALLQENKNLLEQLLLSRMPAASDAPKKALEEWTFPITRGRDGFIKKIDAIQVK
jgi:hypothetical protein